MYIWDCEVIMYGNGRKWYTVETETENWYDAESKLLSIPGVWDVGYHFKLTRPDGTIERC